MFYASGLLQPGVFYALNSMRIEWEFPLLTCFSSILRMKDMRSGRFICVKFLDGGSWDFLGLILVEVVHDLPFLFKKRPAVEIFLIFPEAIIQLAFDSDGRPAEDE